MIIADAADLEGLRLIDTHSNRYATIQGRYQNRKDAAAFVYDFDLERGLYAENSAAMIDSFSTDHQNLHQYIVLDWLDNPIGGSIDAPNTPNA